MEERKKSREPLNVTAQQGEEEEEEEQEQKEKAQE